VVTNPGSRLVIKHVIMEDRYTVPDIKELLAEGRDKHDLNQSQITQYQTKRHIEVHSRDVRRTSVPILK